MSLTRKVAHNVISQVIGKGLSTFLGILTISLIMRYLKTEGFGNYSTVMAYLTLFGVIVEFGLHLTTIQLVSSKIYETKKLIGNIFTFRMLTSLVFFVLAPIIVWFFPYPIQVKLGVLITTFSFFIISINQILIALMQIHLKMQKAAISEVIGRIILLVLVFMAVLYNKGFLLIMGSVVVSSLINFIVNLKFIKNIAPLSIQFDLKIWKEIITRSLPIGISIVFNLIYLKADMLILSLVKSQSDVGLYGATYKFLDILTTFPAMFMGLILPVLTKHWVDNKIDDFKRVFQKAFDFLVIVSFPIVFGTFFTAKKIILLVAGSDFLPAVPVLQLIIFSIIAIFIGGGLFAYTIIALNKQKQMMWGYIVTAVISLFMYLILIPKYSYYGAASVTIFSEVFISVLIIAMVYKTTKFMPKLIIILKVLVACLIMSLVLYIIKDYNLFIMIIVGAIAYFSSVYFLNGINKQMILEVIKLKNR